MMQLTSPLALLLFLLVPAVAWIGWPGRGIGRQREVIALALRILIILCMVGSLAGLTWVQPGDKLAVVFLLDVSDSMPETAEEEAVRYIQEAIEAMQPEDQAALIVFGTNALVDRSMSPLPKLSSILSTPATHQTDLEGAIRLAMAIFPPNAARRLVILSDGIETTGNASAAVRLAASVGIEIIVLPFHVTPGVEALLSEVHLPTSLSEGENFYMDITIQSTAPGPADIQVTARGELLYQARLDLQRGEQTFSLPLLAGSPGFTDYRIQLIPASDTYYQNNELSAFTEVAGPPRILMVAPQVGESMGYATETRPDEYSSLVHALQSANYRVDTVTPSSLPLELVELAQYASVVLVDVPARQLTQRQMETLHSYVRDLGGGLVTVGGPTSYGVGGYFRTPLEELLPVDIQIHDQQRRPSLAIVFIIDHSGSMSETYGNVTKLELAQEAALRSVELLFPTDRVGVIAFDDNASWVVPMTDLVDPLPIMDAISSIRIGGGTDILAGLKVMAAILSADPAQVKHVILLTDGGADPTGIPELVSQLYNDYGITLTTIGVGRDAAPYLADLAIMGGGRYSYTSDPSTIPAIFTEETILAMRAYIVEETFYPQLQTSSPVLAGIESLPPLSGYIGTSARQTAQTILVSHLGDPILAVWQFGLGRVASFTSDATTRWAQAWIAWDGFPLFWSQVVESTLSTQVVSPLQIQVTRSGDDGTLLVDAVEISLLSSGTHTRYLNDYQLQAKVIQPSGDVSVIDLEQIAPGQYQATFQPPEQGVYLIQVDGQPPDPQSPPLTGTTGWVLDYSPEYRILNPEAETLAQQVAEVGGRLAPINPDDIFIHNLDAPRTQEPVWPWLLLTAALLFPLDIAVRRLVFGKEDFYRFYSRLRRIFNFLKPKLETGAAYHRPSVQGLLKTKARVHIRQSPATEIKPVTDEPPVILKNGLSTIQPLGQGNESQPTSAGNDQSLPNQPAQSTASQLLARKRAQRGKRDSENSQG